MAVDNQTELLRRLAARFTPEAFETSGDGQNIDPSQYPPGELRLIARRLANGEAPEMIRPDLSAEALAVLFAQDPDAAAPRLRVLTAHMVLSTEWPEPKALVPGLLVIGLNILAGKPKVGKSWLALQLAHAVSAGGMSLGQRVERGPVLYLALEDSPSRLKKRMLMQQWDADRAPADFITMTEFAEQIGGLWGEGLGHLAAEIRTKGYRLVVIDTFSRALRCDQDRVHEVTAALSPLQTMGHELNCAVLLLDHHRKAADGENPLQDVLGSVAKSAIADSIWGLYKQQGKAGAVLKIEGRDIDDQILDLRFDRLTGSWQVQATANGMPLAGGRADVLEAVRSLGQATLEEVIEMTGADKGNAYRYLQDLTSEGYLLYDKSRRPARYSVSIGKQVETTEQRSSTTLTTTTTDTTSTTGTTTGL